jgi:hypothetical protein
MKKNKKLHRSAGLTLIELLVSIVVGSLVLMMLMQLINMNVSAQRVYEYENFVTDETLFITLRIQNNLDELQPHRVDRVETATEITITFTHEYDVIIDPVTGRLTKSTANAVSESLVYDKVNETLTYEGVLLHSSRLKIQSGTLITLDYYEDTDPDPTTCSDLTENGSRLICGDGIVEFSLEVAIEYDSGNRGETFTYVTRIIV